MSTRVKIALPKGRLMAETAAMFDRAGWGLKNYTSSTRSYRLESDKFPDMLAKIFNERDIPVQVAIGNYDIGICCRDWLQELTSKYPSSPLMVLRDLDYGQGSVYVVASRSGDCAELDSLCRRRDIVRLVGEYPNLAESFALKNRLRRFSIFPLWGAAEVYPPESAELALLSGEAGKPDFGPDMVAVSKVLDYNACIIVNRDSWAQHDLSAVLASLDGHLPSRRSAPAKQPESAAILKTKRQDDNTIRLALPDGHQQKHAVNLLTRAGISFDDYPSASGNRRPASSLDGVSIKVIRPQDMPAQVANGNFDLAITGRDWLTEHLIQFPSSPVSSLLDLKFARVRIVAVVCNDVPVSSLQELKDYYADKKEPVRIASEYTNIADRCLRDTHIGSYRVIPTWGATEAFLPEDADMLIENTETGSTIARHNLKIIDELFVSTGCLVGHKESVADPAKAARIQSVVELLRSAVE